MQFPPERVHNTAILPREASPVGEVDDRNPLIQTAAVSAESVHFAQRRVLPQRRLRVLLEEESSQGLVLHVHTVHYETFCKQIGEIKTF